MNSESVNSEHFFDTFGNLQPSVIQQWTLSNFQDTFVSDFGLNNSRETIFEQYFDYVSDLKRIFKVPFFQWVDGSFISQKLNPKDIDIVTFIDADIFLHSENRLRNIQKSFFPLIDGYFVQTFPENHKRHPISQLDQAYWQDFFGKTRFNRAKKQQTKGIIQLSL